MHAAMDSRHPHLTRERFARVLLVLAGALVVAVMASAMIGSQRIDLGHALFGGAESNVDAVILFRIRLPRALMAVVVGGALAAAGTVLQALLRNPLAEPHLLGVSGGAAFGGVVALIVVGATGLWPAVFVPVGAFAGALVTMLIVYRLGAVAEADAAQLDRRLRQRCGPPRGARGR